MYSIKAILLVFLTIIFFQSHAINSFQSSAKVESIKEVFADYQIEQPYRYCYDQRVKSSSQEGDGSATNELIGGIIGGAIGNRIGKGDGKKAATVAGALLGASIAHDNEVAANQKDDVVRIRKTCETRYRTVTQREFSHYAITYNYKGRIFTYSSEYKVPIGSIIPIRVSLDVVE